MEDQKPLSDATQNVLPQQPQSQNNNIPPEYLTKIQDSKYYMIRSILKDLRPQFLEVLQTPDFRKCKASQEIQKQMKILSELYKELPLEGSAASQGQSVNVESSSEGSSPERD